jgi:uncharacterized OB-fold protein
VSAALVPPKKRSRSRKSERKARPKPAAPARAGVPGPPPTTSPSAALPYLLDFYPLQDSSQTRVSAFFQALKKGRFTTTRCRKDGQLLWPPRVVCPVCHTADLEWVDLPAHGQVYAFSALLAGAPLGMENDLPLLVGLVELADSPLRLFGRIVGIDWRECRVGQSVRVEPVGLPDGRTFYQFRAEGKVVDPRR